MTGFQFVEDTSYLINLHSFKSEKTGKTYYKADVMRCDRFHRFRLNQWFISESVYTACKAFPILSAVSVSFNEDGYVSGISLKS